MKPNRKLFFTDLYFHWMMLFICYCLNGICQRKIHVLIDSKYLGKNSYGIYFLIPTKKMRNSYFRDLFSIKGSHRNKCCLYMSSKHIMSHEKHNIDYVLTKRIHNNASFLKILLIPNLF